jgi:hypothetical protein
MSENITFNLPITISRERFDAIVKEAARKICTDGLFDPTDVLAPAVTEAVQRQMKSPPLPIPTPQTRAPVDTDFLKLVDLINSSEWVYYEGSPRMRDAAVLWGPEVRRGGSNLIPSVGAICYMLPRYPGVLFLAHLNKQVRDILGRDAGHTLRGWLSKGLLMQCRTNAIDKVVRYSQNVSVFGESFTLSRINIAKLEELGISVNLFQFP